MNKHIFTILAILIIFWGLGTQVHAQEDANSNVSAATTPLSVQWLPLVSGGNNIQPFYRYYTWLTDFDLGWWCAEEYDCQPTDDLNDFTFTAPSGYVISLVRLFTYELGRADGGHVIYIQPGCLGQVCVLESQGSWLKKQMTEVKVVTDPSLKGSDFEVNFADFCIERYGFDYHVLCDKSWDTAHSNAAVPQVDWILVGQ